MPRDDEDTPPPPLIRPQAIRPGAGDPTATPFQRLGGRPAVEELVDRFYDRVDQDPELRAIFPPDLTEGRRKQKLFFEQWLGGEPLYSAAFGHPRLRARHLRFAITRHAAERWLIQMRAAMDDCTIDPSLADEILEALRPLAEHMVNRADSE